MLDIIKRNRLVFSAAGVLILLIVLLSIRWRGPGQATVIDETFNAIAYPFQAGFAKTASAISEILDRYVLLVNVNEENEQLKIRTRALEEELNHYINSSIQFNLLREQLKFKEDDPKRRIYSEVIGESVDNFHHTLLINKGHLAGIRRNYPVVLREGVVGRVQSASALQSVVQTWIVELHPYAASSPSRPEIPLVPNSAFRAQASTLDERLPLAFDGDVNTRWFTGDRQSGDEWVKVEFDEPRTVRRIRFEVSARSMGDYPRRLRVESSVDGERFEQVVFEDSGLTALVVGTGRNRGATFIDIDLPSVPSRALRLRQIGQTRAWYWSIDELTFWEEEEARSEPGGGG